MSITVAEAILSRRATRSYLDKPVPQDIIDRVVDLALESPSAFNLQQREIVIVQDPDVRQALFDASQQAQILAAPVTLVIVAITQGISDDAEQIVGAERLAQIRKYLSSQTPEKLREQGIKDAVLAAGFALVAAQAEGLASSPMTGYQEEKVKEAIGLGGRNDRAIALLISMGYSEESPSHPGRAPRRIVNRYED